MKVWGFVMRLGFAENLPVAGAELVDGAGAAGTCGANCVGIL